MMLVTLRGGPTLHIWWEGCEIASVPLTPHAALELAAALLREARAALARGEVAGHVGGCNMPPPPPPTSVCAATKHTRRAGGARWRETDNAAQKKTLKSTTSFGVQTSL
jgi:hypothetical protein